jgi:polar amino acid transport system substrate-binding protein
MGGEIMLRAWAYRSVITLFLFGHIHTASALELTLNTQEFAPFHYKIDGAPAGPGVEVVRRICAEMNAKCKVKVLPWRRAQDEVRSGKANGMFLIGWNEKRAKWVHFSPPIFDTEYGFFFRADNPKAYEGLPSVEGYKVGVYGPSNTAMSLEKIKAKMVEEGLKPIRIDMRPDDEAGFIKLGLGRLDAVFSNRDVGSALVAKLNLQGKVRFAGATKQLKYYVGFSMEHNDAAVLREFDAAYRRLHAQGAIKTILDRHNMVVANPE